jgi:hypothetical protein
MNRILKILFTTILITSLLIFNNVGSAYALDGSRFLTCLLFVSGLGASAAGAVTHGQANEIYDKYMHSAVQADMDNFINDYDQKRQQSIITSRVGVGLAISAVLISLLDAHSLIQAETLKISDSSGLQSSSQGTKFADADLQKGEIRLGLSQRF